MTNIRSCCFILTLLIGQFTIACNCSQLKPLSTAQLAPYNAIFKGVVDSLTAHTVYFEVQQAYKGKLTEYLKITFDDSSDCRMTFSKNDTWLIYAKYISYGNLQVDFCSRSRKYFSDNSKDYYITTSLISFDEELDFLRKNAGIQNIQKVSTNTNTLQKPELIQPSSNNKIWLILGSLFFFLSIILLFKKYF